eukprot:CAMPEP_0119398646 /NCGR_PEP_ID=MMETSP1334-20130426/140953_1 /TAXON_ID=127549 /ORGANISM="Calcidiscus leptoporus, Strain RCC1130" /LENGTH=228 /DNA_ID=CAMNT_0007422515 /DNA_START=520 /DNA_END=1204 /DNA_ORIENTATION=-
MRDLGRRDARSRLARCGISVGETRSRRGSAVDLGDHLDLDGHVAGERVGPHRRARVCASLSPEDFADDVGAPVNHLRLLRVGVDAIDETNQLHDASHLIEVAHVRLERAHQLEPDELRKRRRLFRRVLLANLADVQLLHVRGERHVAREVHEAARLHDGCVRRERLRHRWQRETELLDLRLGVDHAVHAGGAAAVASGANGAKGVTAASESGCNEAVRRGRSALTIDK